jgi:hypothetical protein
MSRAPGKYVAGTMAPAGAALDRPGVEDPKGVCNTEPASLACRCCGVSRKSVSPARRDEAPHS